MSRPDGTMKIRAVDHFSWVAGQRRCKKRRKAASVNGHCVLTEKISHDHVDDIVAGMASLRRLVAVSACVFFMLGCVLQARWGSTMAMEVRH